MKIVCRTCFDCSYTGITGHFRPAEIPFVDFAGQQINTREAWNRSRNQQRNYETLMQIFGLRTQPLEVSIPVCQDGIWEFVFEVENPAVFYIQDNNNVLAGLEMDCDNVPMMLNLNETKTTNRMLIVSGPDQNIWFDAINN